MKKVYYSVSNGRKNGIYETWKECEEQVKGFPSATYKKFDNYKDAEFFLYIPVYKSRKLKLPGLHKRGGRLGARGSSGTSKKGMYRSH